MAGFHGGVFPGGAFTVIFFPKYDRTNICCLVFSGRIRHGHKFSQFCIFGIVSYAVGLVVKIVDRTDEAIVGYIFQMPPVLKPGTCHGNVIGGAFSLGLDQQAHPI